MLELGDLTNQFAEAFTAVDRAGLPHAKYQPGIGPYSETAALDAALDYLRTRYPDSYAAAAPRQYPRARKSCDLVIPGQWALEFKLIRPYGNNGREAEHWSENVLHPYPGNTSAIGDCLKLSGSGFEERKAVVVYGFEHSPPQLELEPAVRAFEVIAREVVGVDLGRRQEAVFTGLIHPIHQQGRIYVWQVFGVNSQRRR